MPNHTHLIWRVNEPNGKESPKGSFLKLLLVFAMTLSGAFAQASEGILAFNLESIFSQSQTEVLNASETQDISASNDTRFNTVLSWYNAGESVTFAMMRDLAL